MHPVRSNEVSEGGTDNPINPERPLKFKEVSFSFVDADKNNPVNPLDKSGNSVIPGGVLKLVSVFGNVGNLVIFIDLEKSRIINVGGKFDNPVIPSDVLKLTSVFGNVGNLLIFDDLEKSNVVNPVGKFVNPVIPEEVAK